MVRRGEARDKGREDVSETASVSTGIAARYASALFDLAKEAGALKALESDADALKAALAVSPDLAAMIGSPVISRSEQAAENHKPERARRHGHTILLNSHGPWQRHGARFYHDSR